MNLRFKSIKARLTFWFLLLAILPLLIGLILAYNQRVEVLKKREFAKLTAIRDLKVEQLKLWLNEKIGDLNTLSCSLILQQTKEILDTKNSDQNHIDTVKNYIRKEFNNYLSNYKDYKEIFLIDPVNGFITVSNDMGNEGQNKSHREYFVHPSKYQHYYIHDIYYSQVQKKPQMTLSTPVFYDDSQIICLGILVFRIDLEHSLYELLLNRTGMGKTGEILIINKDLIALNELRGYEHAPLSLQINSAAAIKAAKGEKGIVETTDYDGDKVLAAYTYIPETRWGLVIKQDLEELYKPIQYMFIYFVFLFLVSLIIVYFISIIVANKISKPVLEMTENSKQIQQGNFSVKNKIITHDELGFLAKSFNKMAKSIMTQMEIQQSAIVITETIISSKKITDFRINFLDKIISVTESNMGIYYVLNLDTNIFEHFTSIGAHQELLQTFDASIKEGDFGLVLQTKNLIHLKNIPENTIFKLKTFIGTIIPKEIIYLPIIIQGIVRAVVALAKITPYSQKTIAILNHPWVMSLETSLSNIIANDKTRRLAYELEEKNRELQAHTEELQAQAAELQKQNIELEYQRQQVEEADKLKSQFLSNMSHELRTPLNSVLVLSKVLMMQTKQKLSDEEMNYLEIIEKNGKHLLSLINDILDLSKIEAGKMDVNPVPFFISSTIDNIIEQLTPISEEKGISLSYNIPNDCPQIENDGNRLHHILQNIIGNAVKFTKKGGVKIIVNYDVEKVYIDVIDTGIGIAEKNIPYIFEEFRQIDGTSSREYEGTGLGLAIAYKTARMLGGDIYVKSQLGKGTKFTICLPIKWQGIATEHEHYISSFGTNLTSCDKTILVVDDNPEILKMISSYLDKEGYNTVTTTSGNKAVEFAEIHQPFAITLDVIMPDIDGFEVLQQLKENPSTSNIPVIIVSVSNDKQTGVALGAVGYLTKPVNKNMLLKEIAKISLRAPKSVLIVDDNEIESQEIAKIMKQHGMKTLFAPNGIKCLEILTQYMPDIVVLDLIMPGMNGFEVIDKIRNNPATQNLPVIVITAKDLSPEEKEKLKLNVSSILVKSDTTSSYLLNQIRETLAKIDILDNTKMPFPLIRRLLLVEDNEASIIQVKTVLENEGYIIDVTKNGEQALDYMEHTIPDGIILDLMMPGVDGFTVLEKIRQNECQSQIPVLILTAKDITPEDSIKLKNSNIQHLIQKGNIKHEDLIQKIKTTFEQPDFAETYKIPKTYKIEDINSFKQPHTSQTIDQIEEKSLEKIVQKDHKQEYTQRAFSTILVVEDNPDNMITVKALLKDKFQIIEATDGEEGLKKTILHNPDLILLDISLPKMDGFSVIHEIRKNKDTSYIPVIALTAHAMKGDRNRIIEAGCDDYLAKPIDSDQLLQKIQLFI